MRLWLGVWCVAALCGCDVMVIAGDPYAVEPPPVKTCAEGSTRAECAPCTFQAAFERRYRQPWSPDDVAYVTSDAAVWRGLASLNVAAAKSAHLVRVFGSSLPVVSLRLYRTGGDEVLRQLSEPEFLAGLGHTLWREANGYGGVELTETLLHQLVMEPPSALQQRANLEVTLRLSERAVPVEDRADWRRAADLLIEQVKAGTVVMKNGNIEAISMAQSLQVVNGKRFRFQFSNSWGMAYELGVLREGAWGPHWSLGMPVPAVCGECAEASLLGKRYSSCSTTVAWEDARQACHSRGGELASFAEPLEALFVRALQPEGERWIGLTDAEAEGTFRWVDATPLAFTRWRELEPNDLDEDCTVQVDSRGTVALWNDRPCSSNRGYACELP
jgi:hypothetical protein